MNEPLENNITIRKAEGFELELVKRFYRVHNMRPQAAKSDDVYIALRNKKIICALRLCTYEGVWLLRSMCVAADDRCTGVGSHMLSELKAVLSERPCYCFPFAHLEAFYQRAGFISAQIGQVPQPIAKKYSGYLAKNKKILLMKFAG